jgi:hypothetical protein
MKLTDFTALGRTPIDPSYPTNLAIATLALGVTTIGVILSLLTGAALLESVLSGIGAGLVPFLTWALGRELDPDHDLSAFVGAGLALAALFLLDDPSLLMVLWLLLLLRTVNRTVGLPLKPLDSLAVFGLGAWLTWQGYWLAGLATGAALLLDGLLSPPFRAHLLLSGLAFAATAVLSIFRWNPATVSSLATPVVLSSMAVAALFLVVIATSRQVHAVGDATGKALNPRRVQAAQVLALVTALGYALWGGSSGILLLLPLWAAIAGVALYRLAILLLPRRRSSQSGG